jgi:hypothetical protein
MPSTYTLISSNVLSSSAASVTFSAIPSTYTDLVVRISARTDQASTTAYLTYKLNGGGTGLQSETYLGAGGGGTTPESGRTSNSNGGIGSGGFISLSGNSATANTFGSVEIYIPSYTASQNKPTGNFGVGETNATAIQMGITAGMWRNTAAVTTIAFSPSGSNFLTGSSFYLYGIKNS